MTRTILHIDLDAFFCAVEELKDPSLIGKPFAVGGQPGKRGVVSSCSYAARRFGVRSAMPTSRALRLCPKLIIISPHHKEYSKASRRVMDILHRWTDTIEQISIDEAFLDISALEDPIEVNASLIQTTIYQELKLPCSIGVAANKLVAKTANDLGKASSKKNSPPQAITIVPEGQEANFLEKLPVEALWGVGPKTAERLEKLEIFTIGELANFPVPQLENLFGKIGRELSHRAKGIDDRPLVTIHEPKSFSNEITFSEDIKDYQVLIQTLKNLSEKICIRLKHSNRTGTTIKLKLRWADFTTFSRQRTLSSPTDNTSEVFEQAKHLFEENWLQGKAVRLIGVGVSGIRKSPQQLNLWDYKPELCELPASKLDAAIKEIREQYGDRIIQFGMNPRK